MRWYIAGPISSNPDGYRAEFAAAAEKLKAQGWEVVNPAENPPEPSWEAYMKVSLRQLVDCDGVALLKGWERSEGASWEESVAKRLKMPRLYL
jgi:Asp-tRNA(Asn)/Glu-tRNA(Gln) amidotransferase A subunit family amidase